MLKHWLYKGVFLKSDVENVYQNIHDKTKVKNILDSISEVYYESIFDQLLALSVSLEELLTIEPFRNSAALYDRYFFDEDVRKILTHFHEKEVLKTIIPTVHPDFVVAIYEELLDQLSAEEAKKIAGYSIFVTKKQDLSFLYEEQAKDLHEKISLLEKEIQQLKQLKETLQETTQQTQPIKEEEKETTPLKNAVENDEDLTEIIGKEIFKA